MNEVRTPAVMTAPGRTALLRIEAVPDVPSALDWVRNHRDALRTALDRHGAVLLRGLPVTDTVAFGAVRDVLFDERVAYREKATPRSDYGDDVFSSTDLPADQPIRQHNENSYTLEFPGLLLFGCLVAPPTGGATTVADVREVLAALDPDVVTRFRTHGWELRRTYQPHVGLPWTTAFGTDERGVVEDYCRRSLIGLRWDADDTLTTTQVRTATIRHPRTGEEVWFNHAAFWNEFSLDPEVREVLVSSFGADRLPFQTRLGDGTALDASVVAGLNRAYDAAERREPWEAGDLLLVDNILCSHGREAFRGDRRIVVAMGQPVRVADCSPTVAAAPGTASTGPLTAGPR